MKTTDDPRHIQRVKSIKQLFAQSFSEQQDSGPEVKAIIKDHDRIDELIKNAAPAWPIDKLNKIDLAILRYAIYELTSTSTPPKVIIDEAVEIAKKYGSEKSASFVNGVLGTIFKNQQ